MKQRSDPVNAKHRRADFYLDVYDVVRLIPRGRVTSYGAIAAYLGAPGAARMVGYALNAVHTDAPDVPAHRVVNRLGILSGKHHFPPPGMETLLYNEGIQVENDQVVKFEALFWDPTFELG